MPLRLRSPHTGNLRAFPHGHPALAGNFPLPQSEPVTAPSRIRSRPVCVATGARFNKRRWIASVTAGEAFGFLVPGVAWFAAWKLGLPPLLLACVVVAAGGVEGAVLGWSQWRVLREWQPAVTVRWVGLTALAAALAWACGMAPNTIHDLGAPAWASIAAGIAGAPVLLLGIGVAQWSVLRGFVPRAWRWVVANVLAWVIALPPTFIGPALVPSDAPVVLDLAAWGASGVMMAAILAAITGEAIARLAREAGARAPG